MANTDEREDLALSRAEYEETKRQRVREEIRNQEKQLQIDNNFREHVTRAVDATEETVRDLSHVVTEFVGTRASLPDRVQRLADSLDGLRTSVAAIESSVAVIRDSQREVLLLKEQLVPKWLRNLLVAGGVAIASSIPILLGQFVKFSHLSEHLDKIMPWLDRMATLDWRQVLEILEKMTK